jgi:hypothetical protein
MNSNTRSNSFNTFAGPHVDTAPGDTCNLTWILRAYLRDGCVASRLPVV